MKAGEFTRKLKSAINEAGYTSNNVDIVEIVNMPPSFDTFKVSLIGNDDNELELYID